MLSFLFCTGYCTIYIVRKQPGSRFMLFYAVSWCRAVYRVLLRTITEEGVVRSFGSAASPWMRPRMQPTAVGAVQSRRESIVVSGICRYADSSMLSKPITWTSSGTRRPEARKTDSAPIASWSFSATILMWFGFCF